MATNLSVKVGTLTTVSILTPFVVHVTGLGFQPKVVILVTKNSSTDAAQSVGYSDGTNHRSVAWGGFGGSGTSETVGVMSDTKATIGLAIAGSMNTTCAATVAMVADGFDLTFDHDPQTFVILDWFAIGGTDVGSIAIGTQAMPTTAIANSVTGLSFQPSFVMLLSGSRTAANYPVLATNSDAHLSYGCAVSATKRFSHSLCVANGQTMSTNVNGVSDQRTDKCLIGLSNAAALEYAADFTSFNADGFTITFSTAPASAYQYYYLAIGGTNLKWDIGTGARPTTAIAQTVTAEAFQPQIGLWSDSSLTTLNTVTSNAVLSLGASDGTNTQAIAASHNDAINTVCGNQSAAKAVIDGVPSNTAGTASFTSFNSDGWTITWGATGAADQISWVMLAGTTIGGATPRSPTLTTLGVGSVFWVLPFSGLRWIIDRRNKLMKTLALISIPLFWRLK